jgi:hypothetical protein
MFIGSSPSFGVLAQDQKELFQTIASTTSSAGTDISHLTVGTTWTEPFTTTFTRRGTNHITYTDTEMTMTQTVSSSQNITSTFYSLKHTTARADLAFSTSAGTLAYTKGTVYTSYYSSTNATASSTDQTLSTQTTASTVSYTAYAPGTVQAVNTSYVTAPQYSYSNSTTATAAAAVNIRVTSASGTTTIPDNLYVTTSYTSSYTTSDIEPDFTATLYTSYVGFTNATAALTVTKGQTQTGVVSVGEWSMTSSYSRVLATALSVVSATSIQADGVYWTNTAIAPAASALNTLQVSVQVATQTVTLKRPTA